MAKKKIAIACQGGGSHTAFTAGALKRILEEDKNYEIIALSGTSGGAICAVLARFGLLTGGNDKAIKLLDSFWEDISASTLGDLLLNEWIVETSSIQDKIFIPQVSPYDFPPFAQEYLRILLENQVKFDELKKFEDRKPELIVAAVDVFSGEFSVFKNAGINSDVILASAAIPTFFQAVPLDKYLFNWNKISGPDKENLVEFLEYDLNIDWASDAKIEMSDNNNLIRVYKGINSLTLRLDDIKSKVYLKLDNTKIQELILKKEKDERRIYRKSHFWDGLFSQNPPVRDFVDGIDEKPEEIWVIQINPKTITKLPQSLGAIQDRRNELAGNLSLYQELYFIEKVNEWIKKGKLKKGKYQHIDVRFIKMLWDLDVETKLDRNPEFIRKMMKYGEEQAGEFLKPHPSSQRERLGNIVYE